MIVAGLATMAVVGGVVVAVQLADGSGGTRVDGRRLPAAVTSAPEEAWSYDAAGGVGVDAVGGTTLVTRGEEGGVVALDEQGSELWSSAQESYGYAFSFPGDDDYVVVQGYESDGVGVVALSDGEELWSHDDAGGVADFTDDALLTVTYEDGAGDLTVLDVRSGETRWSLDDVDAVQEVAGATYVVRHGELSRLDSASGDEEWSVGLDPEGDDYYSLAAVDDLVVVGSGDARAFSSDGDALWSEQSPGVDASLSVGALSDDSVFLNTSDYDDDVTSEEVTVFDAEGEVGEIGIDDDTSFYGFAFESGGVRYLLNESDGTLYDDTLDRVGSYGGRLAVADSGIYSLDGDRLRFYEYGENAAAWEVDVDGSDSLSVMAGDGVVLVSDERSVTAYR